MNLNDLKPTEEEEVEEKLNHKENSIKDLENLNQLI